MHSYAPENLISAKLAKLGRKIQETDQNPFNAEIYMVNVKFLQRGILM